MGKLDDITDTCYELGMDREVHKQQIKDLFVEVFDENFFTDVTVQPHQTLSSALRAKAEQKVKEL